MVESIKPLLFQTIGKHILPIAANSNLSVTLGVVVLNGPLRVAGDVIWLWVLRSSPKSLPHRIVIVASALLLKHGKHCILAFTPMPVVLVLLIGAHLFLIHHIEIRGSGRFCCHQLTRRRIAIVLHNTPVTCGIGNVEVVIAPA